MAKQITTGSFKTKTKIKRKGVHAKSKSSSNPGSKNYKKPMNRGGN
jgi:hypothetical protein